MSNTSGIEEVYSYHHSKQTWGGKKVILSQLRGAFLRKYIGTGKTVLDLGCRDGGLTETYCKGNTVMGVDVDSAELAKARELGITTAQVDLNGEWGLEGPFDVVQASEIIEHLYYPEVVIKKIKQILSPNGMLIGSGPHAFPLLARIRLFFGVKYNTSLADPTHINHFTAREFIKLLTDNFREVEVYPIVVPKYQWLSKIFFFFPYLFADRVFYVAKQPK